MSLYTYRAKCLRVVDGDTIWLEWKDYGDGMRIHGGSTSSTALSLRFAAVNVYEKTLRGDTTPEEKLKGIEATAWLKEQIEGKLIRLKSVKSGSKGNFGRYLVFVFTDGPDDEVLDIQGEHCLNLSMLELGYGVVSKYEDGAFYEGLGYPREEP